MINFAFYSEGTEDVKPVEMEALALRKTKVKLLSVKQEEFDGTSVW